MWRLVSSVSIRDLPPCEQPRVLLCLCVVCFCWICKFTDVWWAVRKWVAYNNSTPVQQAVRVGVIPLEIKSHLIYTCNDCSGLKYCLVLHVTSVHGILLPRKLLCKQNRHYTYLWICHVTSVTVEKEPRIFCFSTLSQSRHDFRKQLLNIKCVFWFSLQLLSEIFLILRRVQSFIIVNVRSSACIVPANLVRFNQTWILWTDFRTTPRYHIEWKFVQWEPGCSARTDTHDEAIRRFSQYCELAWNCLWNRKK